MADWQIYQGNGAEPHEIHNLPTPPWRTFSGTILNLSAFHPDSDIYSMRYKDDWKFFASQITVDLVNAALHLRRPLLISGNPGSGKSSLAYDVARELKLGAVLRWSITSSTKLSDGLYHYDAIGRLQEATPEKSSAEREKQIGKYIRLGPLGSALIPSPKPRVLLIDEIDKSDIDLPNDLLHVFEEGEFEIPELVRLEYSDTVDVFYGGGSNARVSVQRGHVRCNQFPFIFLTSNDERQFPPAFLRRCLRLRMKAPETPELLDIVTKRFNPREDILGEVEKLIKKFVLKRDQSKENLATDQLLNAVYLIINNIDSVGEVRKEAVVKAVLEKLSNT